MRRKQKAAAVFAGQTVTSCASCQWIFLPHRRATPSRNYT